MAKYNPQKIEKKWQKYWEAKKLYVTKDSVSGKKNKMLLTEFAYPSGNLHIGHWYAFALPDIKARFMRMKGDNVLYPTGFDAFGLPAENAAIKNNIHPETWTKKNIAYMTKQLKSMGTTFDWSRQVSTIDPNYYTWTQWMFLQFYKAGLAYRAETNVNWCPNDKTVLANEQVIDGKCERCKTEVVQKKLAQWMFKITEFKDALIDDLDKLDWQETAKLGQKNWIGRSEGAELKFEIKNSKFEIEVFTTRPDTLFGCTFLVLAPEHELVQKLKSGVKNWHEVESYIKQAKNKSELARQEQKDKTGVELEGIKAVNPANKKEIPVFIADYVMMGYGTGAIMAVPAHDQRDFEFAKKYDLPIQHVIMPRFIDHKNPHVPGKEIVFRKGIIGIVKNPKTGKYLCLNWKVTPWKTFIVGGIEGDESPEQAARREIHEETGYKNLKLVKVLGEPVQTEFFAAHKNINRVANTWNVLFELENEERDEVSVEEQKKHEVFWLNESEIQSSNLTHTEINVILDRMQNGEKAFLGEGILRNSGKFDGADSEKVKWEITKFVGGKKVKQYRLHDWILSRQRYWGVPIPMVFCKTCGYLPVAEKELPVKLPPLKDFKPTDDGRSPLAKAEKWLKTKCPKCNGLAERETDTMDTFVDSSWYFLRYTDSKNKKTFAAKEKMKKWLPVFSYLGGAEHTTMHLLYSRFFIKALHKLGFIDFNEPFSNRRNRGIILGPDNQKMSKSRGNVVDPDQEVKKYGADAVRMYLAFMGPYLQGGSWNPGGIIGVYRFLNRVWSFVHAFDPNKKNSSTITVILQKYIKEISGDIGELSFNTGVSNLMKLLNSLEIHALSKKEYEIFLLLLAPFAPHLAEELWQSVLKNKTSIHLQKWPKYDERLLKEDRVLFIVQINGKVRDKFGTSSGLSQAEIEKLVMRSDKIIPWIEGKEIKKIIFVQDKLINIVV